MCVGSGGETIGKIQYDFEVLQERARVISRDAGELNGIGAPPKLSVTSDGNIQAVRTATEAAALGFEFASKIVQDIVSLAFSAAAQSGAYADQMVTAGQMMEEYEESVQSQVKAATAAHMSLPMYTFMQDLMHGGPYAPDGE